MSEPEQIICDACRERPAVNHTCSSVACLERHLCYECFEKFASPEELVLARHAQQVIREGKCKYCGAPAIGGSIFTSGSDPTNEEASLWCEQCRLDSVEFRSKPENKLPEEFPFDDEAAMVQLFQKSEDIKRRENEFILQRVKERRSQ